MIVWDIRMGNTTIVLISKEYLGRQNHGEFNRRLPLLITTVTTQLNSKKPTTKGGERPRTFVCGEDGCEYESKRKAGHKQHKAMIHDIDVTYYLCNADGCEFKAKAHIHDIDVTYYLCVLMDANTRLSCLVILRAIRLMSTIST